MKEGTDFVRRRGVYYYKRAEDAQEVVGNLRSEYPDAKTVSHALGWAVQYYENRKSFWPTRHWVSNR